MDTPQTAPSDFPPKGDMANFKPPETVNPPDDFITSQLISGTSRPGASAKTPGCWELLRLSGSLEGVSRAVQADKNCPQEDKDWVCLIISKLAKEFNHVALHAYCHEANGVWTFDMTMTPSKQLV